MNLERVDNTLFISEEECERLVELLNDGRNLYYEEPFVKIAIDGRTKTLQFYGLETIPLVFEQKKNDKVSTSLVYMRSIKNLIKRVEIGQGAREISCFAFNEFNNLEEVVLPSSLKVIGDYAFANCISLTDINIPKDCKTGENVFNNSPYEEVYKRERENLNSINEGNSLCKMIKRIFKKK